MELQYYCSIIQDTVLLQNRLPTSALTSGISIFLFICFALGTTPFIPKGYVAKERRKSQRPSSIGPLKQRKSVALHGALCARLGGRSTPLQNRNERKRKRTI